MKLCNEKWAKRCLIGKKRTVSLKGRRKKVVHFLLEGRCFHLDAIKKALSYGQIEV
jgi:hypothetical protein